MIDEGATGLLEVTAKEIKSGQRPGSLTTR